jgi:hypothetical protein
MDTLLACLSAILLGLGVVALGVGGGGRVPPPPPAAPRRRQPARRSCWSKVTSAGASAAFSPEGRRAGCLENFSRRCRGYRFEMHTIA